MNEITTTITLGASTTVPLRYSFNNQVYAYECTQGYYVGRQYHRMSATGATKAEAIANVKAAIAAAHPQTSRPQGLQDVFKALATYVAVECVQNSSAMHRMGIDASLFSDLPIKFVTDDSKWSLNRFGKPYQPISSIIEYTYDCGSV